MYTWTVTKPGKYDLTVYAPSKKVAFDPGLMITDASGAEVANVSGGVGGNATTTVEAKAGVYKVKVYLADNFKVKGGYSYEMEIASQGGAAPAVAEPLNGDKELPAEDVAAAPEGDVAPEAAAPAPAAAPKPSKKKGKK